jgi:hypothetical protein
MRVTWPLRALRWSAANVRRFGSHVTGSSGKSAGTQLLEQWRWSMRTGAPPRHYYDYGLYRDDVPDSLGFITQYELDEVRGALDRGRAAPYLEDKQLFAEFCRDHGIATPKLLDGAQAAEQPAIFSKPRVGFRGQGVELWARQADGEYLGPGNVRLSKPRFIAHLDDKRAHGCLIQPLLRNSPAIADLSAGLLCTVRVVTGRSPQGEVRVVAATFTTFKMPWKGRITNTLGLNAAVDLPSGRLGPAYAYSPLSAAYDRHPETGAPIRGRVLPSWQDTIGVARRAHAAAALVFIGWDIALTPDGVVVLEGNAGWDVLTVQKPQGVPLTLSCFVDICRSWAG